MAYSKASKLLQTAMLGEHMYVHGKQEIVPKVICIHSPPFLLHTVRVFKRPDPGDDRKTFNFCGNLTVLGAEHLMELVFIYKTYCSASSPLPAASNTDLFFYSSTKKIFSTQTSLIQHPCDLPQDERSPQPPARSSPRPLVSPMYPRVPWAPPSAQSRAHPRSIGAQGPGLGAAGWSLEPRSAGHAAACAPLPSRTAVCCLTSQHLMKSLPFGSLRDYNVTAAGPGCSLQPSVLLLH